MSYKMELPPEMLKSLWQLKRYCGAGSIIQQLRESVTDYLRKKETEIGTSISDACEAVAKYEYEQESNRTQFETISHMEEQDK